MRFNEEKAAVERTAEKYQGKRKDEGGAEAETWGQEGGAGVETGRKEGGAGVEREIEKK